jgi:hypothetical protein
MTTQHYVLAAAAKGWSVVPLLPRSKVPREDWTEFQSRRMTADEITAHWTRHPDDNYGIVTGAISGLVVADVDPRHGGTQDDLEGTTGLVARTGGGGWHFFFRHPGVRVANRVNVRPGVDVRGDGGYVVGPGSIHESGQEYLWLATGTPGDVPAWLTEPEQAKGSPDARQEPWVAKAFEEGAKPGEQAHMLARLTGYLAGHEIAADVAESMLWGWMQRLELGDPSKPWCREHVERTVASIYSRDAKNFRVNIEDDSPRLVRLADVEGKPVTWLWGSRVPFGKVTILEGDPGKAKSTMTLDLAARLSRGGPMPGEAATFEPADALVLSYEDGVEDTIKWRVQVAGGDPGRVHVYSLDYAPLLDDGGLLVVAQDIRATSAKLLIVDPLMASLAGRVDAHKDQDIRRALKPLAALADGTGAAVLVVRHLNKNTKGSAMHRGGGSIGIAGAARSVMVVARDPDYPSDQTRHVLAPVKMNLCGMPPALKYRVETVSVADGITAPRIDWSGGKTDMTADALLAEDGGRDTHGATVEEAMAIIAEELKDGPVPANVMDARRGLHGVSPATWKRAKQRLGVRSIPLAGTPGKKGPSGWVWELPRTIEIDGEAA